MYTGIRVYRYTGIQVYRHTGIQVYRYTGIQVYRHTGIQVEVEGRGRSRGRVEQSRAEQRSAE